MQKTHFGIIAALLLALPGIAHANAASYTAPGTYYFSVPNYGSLTVDVRGAGGGGGGGGCSSQADYGSRVGSAGSAGSYSAFGSVVGYGGGGGGGGGTGQTYWLHGTPGSASGGSAHYTGGGNPGGAGGQGEAEFEQGIGGLDTGGNGGNGGRSVYTYSIGQLSPGGTVVVYVGYAGSPGYGTECTDGTGTYNGSSGSHGAVYISWTNPPAPSCTINVSPTAVNRGTGATLSWSSSYATSFYISGVGYVAGSGSTTVAPNTTTTYAGSVSGAGGSGSCSRTLTVYQPCTLPWGGSITHGASATAYQASTVPYGSSCVSQTRSCSNGTLSGTYTYGSCSVQSAANCSLDGVTVNHGSSYTFYTAETVPYGSSCSGASRTCTNGTLSGSSSYNQSSCSVQSAANCTQDGVTVNHGSSRTFYSTQTAPIGSQCTAVSQSRSCTNGTLSGSTSYQYASCSCAPTYSCSGNSIQYTGSNCTTTTVATCAAPSSCVSGQSSCMNPQPSFVPFGEAGFGLTGHLQIRPGVVRPNTSAKIYWNVENVQGCTVTGSNGDSWTGTTSGTAGRTTSAITQRATYTLTCSSLSGVTPGTVSESGTVVISPVFQEE